MGSAMEQNKEGWLKERFEILGKSLTGADVGSGLGTA
jgi:hypothetical protein